MHSCDWKLRSNEEQTAHLQTGLLRYCQRGPRYEPLGRTPFRSRGHKPIVHHKRLVEFAHRRLDLLTASSDSRLARNEQLVLAGPALWRNHGQPLTLNLRGREKVNAQWPLFCVVHNIEKLADSGWRH